MPTKLDSALLGACGVVMMAAGAQHRITVTVEGVLFTGGCGLDCQLGLGDKHNRLTPTPARGGCGGGV